MQQTHMLPIEAVLMSHQKSDASQFCIDASGCQVPVSLCEDGSLVEFNHGNLSALRRQWYSHTELDDASLYALCRATSGRRRR